MSHQPDDLLFERRDDGLAILTLNRPSKLNALSGDTVRALCARFDEVAADPTLRVLIITGAGRGFCAGWDLTSGSASGGQGDDVTTYMAGQELFAGMVKRVRALDKVVIAAINGVTVGAGLAMTLASDIRLAVRSASFHIGAIRIGLTAGECGISYHLPRLVGAARAFELMLTGRPVQADEAGQIGLVARVVDDATLMDEALAMAQAVLRNSPYATRHTKQLMWTNLEAPSLDAAIELENRAQVLALCTQDFKEAAKAFAEKRPPVFTGK
ncbi:enoyl-CoA hydratase-related protein [Ideonella sp. DXS22W]|uniref:Enoyl-CoA hydratase-related protein n=1 Tax=Pseudaquabacterium inlustre TaxID=2984192 RepID=A0ABU9CFC6_9BURK